MNEKKKMTPELRFPGFADDWEQCKFGEIAQRQSETMLSDNDNPCVEYEDVIAEQGTLNKDITAKGVYKNGIRFTPEDVLYGKLRPYLHNWLNPDFSGVAVGDWWVLRPTNADKNFLFRLVQTSKYDDAANQSSGTKMPRADWKLISNMEFQIPATIEEQERIAEVFDFLDNLITLHQKQLDDMKEYKKGLLQKMFPKGGEKVPEFRFPEFTDDWEQCKLSEIAEVNPKSALPDTFEYVDLESVVGTDILSHRTEKRESAPSRAQRLAKEGDVFYQTVRPYQKNNCIFEKPYKDWVFSTGYAQLRPQNDGYFLLTLLQNDSFVNVVLDRCTGTSYPAINANDLAEIEIMSPSNPNEQKDIGDFFRCLDNLITLHQQQLEDMKLYKKGLLQKMFV